MDHFTRRQGVLHAEDVALTEVAERYGTPTYVYSRATLERHVQVLTEGVRAFDHLLCYAVKANANLALLQVLAELGCGFDAVSVGELYKLLKLGIDPQRIILSGVGKRDDEIATALAAGVLYICAESADELEAIARIAQSMRTKARVCVRVNPDVDAKTHPYISTGLKKNKFGVPIEEALALYQYAQNTLGLEMVGVSCHIGSQITSLEPFIDAAKRMAHLVGQLQAAGIRLHHVGMGGGLGVPYRDETPPSPKAYGAALSDIIGPLGLRLILEPGRVIVGNAGVLLSRVTRLKRGSDRQFVLIDAGMNDLMRPALYDAYHGIETVTEPSAKTSAVDIVGPVCESSDCFAKDRELPELQDGDLVAFRTAGAYGFAMASTYNGRALPAEVLVDGDKALLVRERMQLSDLWRGEIGLDGQMFDSEMPKIREQR